MANFGKLRYFIKLDAHLKPVLGVLVARFSTPKGGGRWLDITDVLNICCTTTTTTSSTSTTTTTSTSSTTTTTTTIP